MIGLSQANTWEGPVALESDVARLRRGDSEALESVMARYQHRLYRYLLRLSREPALAEDLFQQTWMRVAEKIRRYDPQRSFEAWLFSVARNLTIDYLRRYRPESLDEPAGGEEGGESRQTRLVASGPSALDRILDQERAARVTGALAEMPVIYREVLSLRFEEEMKLEEIAEVLETPISTVKTRLRRGLEAMRRKMETKFPSAGTSR
jgi:RNA polymerase sigma-70 factor (ECF subfamily)